MVVQPSVSVVVNTCNRARYLADALRALASLHYPQVEVVVVNGPSTDGTGAVLEGWAQHIKRVDCMELNLSVSRNAGIAAAAGDIIAFIDDDAVPHPDWLSHLVGPYADQRVAAVGGYTVDNTGVRWQARKTICDRYGNAHHVSDYFDERPLNRPGTPFYPSLLGTNSSFRATALRGVGGFDHAYAYLLDETDVCLRLVDAGWRVLYEPKALVWHQFAASHIRLICYICTRSFGATEAPCAAPCFTATGPRAVFTPVFWVDCRAAKRFTLPTVAAFTRCMAA